jgi:hypothetical protein
MKKMFKLVVLVMVVAMLTIGCSFTVAANNRNENKPIKITPAKVATKATVPTEHIDETKEAIQESFDIVSVENEETAVEQHDNIEPIWIAENTIDFAINGKTYTIGSRCDQILNDFNLIAITDGHLREDETVPVCEKMVIELGDECGNVFIIVVRNDMSQPIPLEECTLHELLVERKYCDLSALRVIDVVNGNACEDEWIDNLGDATNFCEYKGFSYYTWEVIDECWIDIGFVTETNEIDYVQLMTY